MIKNILLILLFASSANAATYTVKTSGGDYSTPGDCANAAPASMSADHICEVYTGTFEGWTQSDDGTNGHWIIVRKATGEAPAISSAITLSSRKYIEISSLQLTSIITAMPADNPTRAENIKIVDNTIDQDGGTGAAIRLFGDDVLISGNTFSNIGEDCIRQGGERWVIRDNTINDGFLFTIGHSDFWQSYSTLGNAAYILLENNIFIDADNNDAHFSLANSTTEPVTNQVVRYNKISNVDGGYAIWLDDNSQDADTRYNSSYNNTIVGIRPPDGANQGAITYSGSDNSSAINNIFSDASRDDQAAIGVYYGDATGGSQSYNLYYDPQETLTFSGLASTEVGAKKNVDPLVTSFEIPSNSPAKDMGGPLTNAVGSGSSSTSLVVENAMFFQDGWAGQVGDMVYVRTVARPDVLVDFESGSENDAVTTTTLNASSHGTGGSWVEAPEEFTVSADEQKTAYQTYVAGTLYDDSTGTRAIKYDHDTAAETFAKYHLSTPTAELSAGVFIKIGNLDNDYTTHDLFVFWDQASSVACVAQVYAYADQLQMRAHTYDTTNGTQVSSRFNVDSDKYYWVSIKKSAVGAGSCAVQVYDPIDWSIVGEQSINTVLTTSPSRVWIGDDPHNQASSVHSHFDNLMISTTGVWPLLPTGAVQTARISSINYGTNTITLESAISWQDGAEVGLYADSNGTVVYSGVAPDIGAYEFGASGSALPQ